MIYKKLKIKLIFLSFACAGLLLVCCINKLDKSAISTVKNSVSFNSRFTFKDSVQKVAYFECEDFVLKALDNYSVSSLRQGFFKRLSCSKEAVVNTHNSDVTDTIYTFSDLNNKIQIYRAENNDFIFTFDVSDSIFALNGGVKPCMTKNDFLKKIQISENLDNIVLINAEGTMELMFYFEHDRLKRINSYLYLD
jgi:hypothetical protein